MMLADEPVQAASSVVEVTELAEDVSEDVLDGEFDKDEGGLIGHIGQRDWKWIWPRRLPERWWKSLSEVVEALPASDVVLNEDDIITALEASEVKAMPATPPPLKARMSVFEADFLAEPGQKIEDTEQHFCRRGRGRGEKPVVTESMAHKDEALGRNPGSGGNRRRPGASGKTRQEIRGRPKEDDDGHGRSGQRPR